MILPIRELAAFSSVQCVCDQLMAEERSSARWCSSAPACLNDSRWQSDSVPWSGGLGRADNPLSLRTDSVHDSESGVGCGWRLLPRVPRQYLSQRYLFGHGSFSESLSSLTPHPILAVPFVEVPSPNRLALPQGGRTLGVCNLHVPGHSQLLVRARSPEEPPAKRRVVAASLCWEVFLLAKASLRSTHASEELDEHLFVQWRCISPRCMCCFSCAQH